MRTFLACFTFFAFQALVRAEPGTVAEVLNNLRKGDARGLRTDQYTNAASAVAFLENIGVLEDEKIRLKVVRFSATLMRRAARAGSQQDEQNVEAFTGQMVKILKADPSRRIREEAAKSLLEMVSPRVLDRYHAVLRLAAEERKDIATLLVCASLHSCDATWLAELVRTMKPESRMEKRQIDSILARCGDQAATDRLIDEAGHAQGMSDVEIGELVAALAFVPSERVQMFLGLGLRSDTVVSLPGGGAIPWRNCCARSLVRMHRHDESFPVKRDDYMYSDDELDRIEQWSVVTLGIAPRSGTRRSLKVTPGIHQ
ncbi:MAG: hypothetical protein ACOX5G_01365 [Kiritimatiellia bacterium]|jgi:hypothetical protein